MVNRGTLKKVGPESYIDRTTGESVPKSVWGPIISQARQDGFRAALRSGRSPSLEGRVESLAASAGIGLAEAEDRLSGLFAARRSGDEKALDEAIKALYG